MFRKILALIGGAEIIAGGIMSLWPGVVPQPVILFLIGTGFLIVLVEAKAIYADISPRIKRLFSRGPIQWDLDGFLGASWQEGDVVYVSVFQIRGENRRREPISIKSAKIKSLTTGQEIDVTFKSDGGYVRPEELNDIPSGATLYAHALFYDPEKRTTNTREGLPEDKFLANWGEFEFIITYDKKTFKRSFSQNDIVAQINRCKPQLQKRPRVTRR